MTDAPARWMGQATLSPYSQSIRLKSSGTLSRKASSRRVIARPPTCQISPQVLGQRRGVLDRLAGALGEVLEHRVGGVAQQGHPTRRPARGREPVVHRPAAVSEQRRERHPDRLAGGGECQEATAVDGDPAPPESQRTAIPASAGPPGAEEPGHGGRSRSCRGCSGTAWSHNAEPRRPGSHRTSGPCVCRQAILGCCSSLP
jgi:hypothetical protein